MKQSTPTKLDYAILGLLREASLSGYQIRQIFETSEMGNYSSSPGSIYPALKRLTKLALVETIVKHEDKGKARKAFSLTADGRECLIQWLQGDIKQEEVYRHMDELLLRFAFMDDLIPRERQLQILQQIEHFLPAKIGELQSFLDHHSESIPLNGRLAILHGIEVFQAHYHWVKKAQKRIREFITKNLRT